MHPFYNPKDLTEADLSAKLSDLMAKKSHASRMGMQTLVDNIDLMIDQIYFEREQRQAREEADQLDDTPIDLCEAEYIETPENKNDSN